MKEIKIVEKKKIKIQITAILLTAAFVAGILFIIFGAGKSTFMLVTGIVFTVAGFYCMPIAWIKFGEAKKYVALEYAVVSDGLRKIKDVAWRIGADEESTRKAIAYALENRYITGLKLDAETDSLTEIGEVPSSLKTIYVKCSQCGAVSYVSVKDARCPYCGSPVKIKK